MCNISVLYQVKWIVMQSTTSTRSGMINSRQVNSQRSYILRNNAGSEILDWLPYLFILSLFPPLPSLLSPFLLSLLLAITPRPPCSPSLSSLPSSQELVQKFQALELHCSQRQASLQEISEPSRHLCIHILTFELSCLTPLCS